MLPHKQIVAVILLSGGFGFGIGLLHPTWQVALEPAQVIAGIVHYTNKTPFYVYQTKMWTLLHQILAFFLYLGVSEKVLTFFLSGLAGMLSFQAITLCVLALSNDFLLAIFSPFFIFFTEAARGGINYPVMLLGEEHTYGMLGLSLIFLVVALIGLGQYKIGGILLGIAPSIHISLAIFLWLMIIICLIWDLQHIGNSFKGSIKYIIFGFFISAISLAFHLFVTYDVPKVSPETTSKYLDTFVHYWGSHQRPISVFSEDFFVVMLNLSIALSWLLYLKRDIPKNSLFILRSFIVSVLLGSLSIIYWLPADKIPSVLVAIMPSRWLNFNILGAITLLLGLLGHYRTNFWVQINLLTLVMVLTLTTLFNRFDFVHPIVFIGMCCSSLLLVLSVASRKRYQLARIFAGPLFIYGVFTLSERSQDPVFFGEYGLVFGRYSIGRFIAGSSLCVIGCIILFFSDSLLTRGKSLLEVLFNRLVSLLINIWQSLLNKITSRLFLPSYIVEPRMILRTITLFVFGLVIILTFVKSYFVWEIRKDKFYDWTNNSLFTEASKNGGMLLTSSNIYLIQLRTRRPVLFDGHMVNALTYVAEIGPEMSQILKQIYGIDLFDPPEDIKKAGVGGLLRESSRALWEDRTFEEWDKIRKQFGVTNIITYADWRLNLPEVSRSREFVLYQIVPTKQSRKKSEGK